MLISTLIKIIQTLGSVLMIIVIADIILSYFVSPYNKIRMTLDRIVYPMLNPIRKVIPPLGGLDFSPIVLIMLIQVVEWLLISLLSALR
ncbi:MAG: YggT family protein [Bellilinea sp.]